MLDTDEPDEAAWYVNYLTEHPRHAEAIRSEGKTSAAQFTWSRVLDELLAKVAFLAARNPAITWTGGKQANSVLPEFKDGDGDGDPAGTAVRLVEPSSATPRA